MPEIGHLVSKETRRIISKKLKGRKLTPEHIANRTKSQSGKNHYEWKGGKLRFPKCIDCGKLLTSYKSKRCWKCKILWQKGNNSANWKGGLTPIKLQIRKSDKYKKWRQDIFIRDNFTCQDCGQIGGVLNVHHKKPFYKFLDEIQKNLPLLDLYEAAMIYTPLWYVFNGKTLCKKCHIKSKKIKRSNQYVKR